MNNLKSRYLSILELQFWTFCPAKQNNCEHFEPHIIYRSPYNHQELEWVFCCRAQLRQAATYDISFFAIYTKTKDFRASELPCVPINSTIAVILNMGIEVSATIRS